MEAKEKDLNYWHENASEDFVHTPICVLRYIHELEDSNKQLQEEVKRLKEKAEELRIKRLNEPIDSEIMEISKNWVKDFYKVTELDGYMIEVSAVNLSKMIAKSYQEIQKL